MQIYVVSSDREFNTSLSMLLSTIEPSAIVSHVVTAAQVREVEQPASARQFLFLNARERTAGSTFADIALLRKDFPFAPIAVMSDQSNPQLIYACMDDKSTFLMDGSCSNVQLVESISQLFDAKPSLSH